MASALITGTSSGIGFATALALGRAGHTVFATMRNPGRAPALGEQVAEEKLPVQILTMDVDSDESVAAAVKSIHEQDGQVDVLVNNAGIERTGSVEELSLDVFRETMETNYFGAIHEQDGQVDVLVNNAGIERTGSVEELSLDRCIRCIKAVVTEMRERRAGCIVNVTSIAGKLAPAPFAPYSASKFALEALSECLGQEMKPFNVRVAIVEPGIIDTPMARRIEEPKGESRYPQGRRWAAAFQASLENPTKPAVVADKILEIIESGTWTLRHPVGPDAGPFLDWRAGMTGEAFVELGRAGR